MFWNWFKRKKEKDVKEIKNEINYIEKLNSDIRKIRVLNDVIECKTVVESKKPQDVLEGENILAKGFKRVKNTLNDNAYKTALNNLEEKVMLYNNLDGEKVDIDMSSLYISDMVNKYVQEAKKSALMVFASDKLKLGKIEFVLNVILDNYTKYETNEKSFKTISLVLGEEESFVKNIKESFVDIVEKIHIRPANAQKDPKVVAGLITGVVLGAMLNPVAGVATLAFGTVGMAESVLALCGVSTSTKALDFANSAYDKVNAQVERKAIKEEFYKLDLDQTTFSLAKSLVMIIELNKYRKEDSLAEDLYCTYIEQYIDIKSDVTLKLLMDVDSKENYEKSKVFNNVDKYLVSKLKLA